MGVFDWLRGRPRDTQEERAETRREATGEDGDPTPVTAEEIKTDAEMRRDEEAARHSGI